MHVNEFSLKKSVLEARLKAVTISGRESLNKSPDELSLEDDSDRIRLNGSFDISLYVTGVFAAVIGRPFKLQVFSMSIG